MLGPHLTKENISQVLLRAKYRTKKEIARLVRELDPLPEVPPRIEPLGPAPARRVSGAPTWQAFVRSLCPVRELSPGDRPSDWMEDENEGEAVAPAGFSLSDGEVVSASVDASGQTPPAESLSPQCYKVQFTAGEEYVKLVEEAQALLSHSVPRATLDEIQLRAMRALVTELKRRKHAVVARPQSRAEPKVEVKHPQSDAEPGQSQVESKSPRRRGRHVPAAVRRAVFERDEGRCWGAAPTPTPRDGAAPKPAASSSTTCVPSHGAASTRWTISRCAATPTMPSLPRRISGESSLSSLGVPTNTNRGRRSRKLDERQGTRSAVPSSSDAGLQLRRSLGTALRRDSPPRGGEPTEESLTRLHDVRLHDVRRPPTYARTHRPPTLRCR
jgi:hypothetical protein